MNIASSFECLRRDVRPRTVVHVRTTCVRCALPLGREHSHLVDCHESSLGCACRACALRFANNHRDPHPRYRTVPSTVRFRAQLSCQDAHWRALRIAGNFVFVFRQSAERRWIALLPSPTHPVRVALPQPAWDDFLARHPLFANRTPDVEALLVRRELTGNLECFACGIDRCYALLGIVGEERRGMSRPAVRARVSTLFAELRRAAEATHEL